MKVCRLEQYENNSTRPLYEEIFDEDSRAFVDYYYSEKTKDNRIYVIREDGNIRAMLHLNPYTVMVNGTEKTVNYIVAVATQKEYRRRGYMTELLRAALRDMYADGQSFTFLMPAAEEIYLPHDFRTVYEQERRYLLLPKNVLLSREGTASLESVCAESASAESACGEKAPCSEGEGAAPLKEEECAELAAAANEWLSANYQVYAKRDEAYYRRLMKECASDGGKLILYRRDGKITDCRIVFPEEDSGRPKIMVRIVDVRRMLMSVSLRSLTAVCFEITDPIIRENNRCVVVTGTEYSGVMLMDGKPENSEGTVTIAALAGLLFGAQSVEEICKEEGVVMSDRMKGEMRKLVPLSKIYLNEVV